jgi:outer membrane protein assembly factor BamB
MTFLLAMLLAVGTASGTEPKADWTQWGGPNRNFTVPDAGLAETWPAAGPAKLWVRALGEGYAGISEHDGRLFTMYRRDKDHESVIALDTANGKTVWEYQYDAPGYGGMDLSPGPGPHVQPQLVDGRVFSIGITGRMFCLDEKTGKVIWSHDLQADFGAEKMGRGYGNNLMPYKDTVLLSIGGEGHSIIALAQKDGKLIWKTPDDLKNSYSSPILIHVGEQDQAVFFMSDEVVGIDPSSGKLLWKKQHTTQYGLNISTPVWGGDSLLFISSAYTGGSRVMQIYRQGNATAVKELWFSNKMRIHITDAIRKGMFVMGSSGDFGPSFLTAVDVNTGTEYWRDRSFAKANMILAGEKLILLDEDGKLALAKPNRTGLNVISKAEVLHNNAWTAPTLVGTKLYIRDRTKIMALDLK